MRRFGTALLIGAIALSACSDSSSDFEVADPIDNTEPGDVIALRANGDAVEYVSRRTGEIRSFNTATEATQILATIEVSTDGEQRGLLGHTVIDNRRFAAWTDPDTFDLVVGEVTSGSVDRMIWSGTGTQSKAVGGHLDTIDGKIVLGIGSLTDWATDHGSGAMVTLEPDGNEGQSPVVLSDGWNNPFAFTVLDDGTIWVADNAPDGSDFPVAERDGERIATTDATGPSLDGVAIHRPTDRQRLQPQRRHNIRCTDPLPTLCDLGTDQPELMQSAVGAALGARLVSIDALSATAVAHSRRGRPGTAALRSAIDAWAIDHRPVDTVLELIFPDLVRRHHLPTVAFHERIRGWEVDFRFVGTPVIVECDGWTTHGLDRDQFERDRRKDSDLAIAG